MIEPTAVSFVILNYNGLSLEILPPCLKSVREAVEQDGWNHEVLVVDNGSTDGSVSYIKEHFPFVRIVALPTNQFVTAYNDGFAASAHEICVFLNNDMMVQKDFLPPLLEHFKNEHVFAVGPLILPWGESPDSKSVIGRTTGHYRWGYIKTPQETYKRGMERGRLTRPSYSFHVAAGAYDKKKYLELGGLDPLYAPCYWEDTDLCFRAWRRGWEILYEPRSIIRHKHQGTTARVFKRQQLKIIMGKNRHLFMWKNIFSGRYLIQYFFFLPFRLVLPLFIGNVAPLIGFIRALKDIKMVLGKRREEKKAARRSDCEVFALSQW